VGTTANAKPSKTFFVDMLTRDIELGDAILDLVDNCIDGIQRQLRTATAQSKDNPYEGYVAKLVLNRTSFSIEDNCGGIPRQKAEIYAFRLGRPAGMPAEKLPTVGVYGIGMKRAIFKLGRSATITSVNAGKGFAVVISPDWMASDDDWDLPITDVAKSQWPLQLRAQGGTLIHVDHLGAGVQAEFDPQSTNFIETFKATVATHYAYVIHKGLSIIVNGVTIKPRSLGVLVSKPKATGNRIDPFVYQANKDAVKVDLIVGLYRDIPSQQEIDDELDGKSSASKETCGWTIICNERVVVYADKGRLTGWGEATVPAYHPQFNAIAGIVRFQSSDMSKLPVTTTKRGLEASSELFLAVKDVMREGLKHFTNFTNHWKGHGSERDAILDAAESIDPFEATGRLLKRTQDWSEVRKGLQGKKYVPKLPRPAASAAPSGVTIKFVRPAASVATVADFLFQDTTVDPARIGEELFDTAYARASR
jgi:hypothetical protein